MHARLYGTSDVPSLRRKMLGQTDPPTALEHSFFNLGSTNLNLISIVVVHALKLVLFVLAVSFFGG
jgi:hypothetical protein